MKDSRLVCSNAAISLNTVVLAVALLVSCHKQPELTKVRTSYPNGWPHESYSVLSGTTMKHGRYTEWAHGRLVKTSSRGSQPWPLPLSAHGMWEPFIADTGDHIWAPVPTGGDTLTTFQGQKLQTGEYIRGRKNGVWRSAYSCGRPHTLESWLRGTRHGIHKRWRRDKSLVAVGGYISGKRQGYWKDSTGEACFVRGRRVKEPDSTAKTFGPNGAIASRTEYRQGKRNGIHREWDKDGRCVTTGAYVGGKRSGYWRTQLSEGCYHNGRKCGFWHESSYAGRPPGSQRKKEESGLYVSGKRHGWWTSRTLGMMLDEITTRVRYEEGEPVDSQVTKLPLGVGRARANTTDDASISWGEAHAIMRYGHVLSWLPEWAAAIDSIGSPHAGLEQTRCGPLDVDGGGDSVRTSSSANLCVRTSCSDATLPCTVTLDVNRPADTVQLWRITPGERPDSRIVAMVDLDGAPLYKAAFEKDVLHGSCVYYYAPTDIPPGRPWEEWTWRHGVLHGPYTRWSPNGDTIETAMYENDSCVAQECRR